MMPEFFFLPDPGLDRAAKLEKLFKEAADRDNWHGLDIEKRRSGLDRLVYAHKHRLSILRRRYEHPRPKERNRKLFSEAASPRR